MSFLGYKYVGDFSPVYKDTTISSPVEDFTPVIDAAISKFEQHERTGQTWYTTHAPIYDLGNKTLTLIPHETGLEYMFGILDKYFLFYCFMTIYVI